MPLSTQSLLERALSRGLITADQHASLLALAAEDGAAPREMPRGFNWVTVAYALGALLVVFAGGWFLAQRWLALGPAGVLLVVLVYAGAAIAASRWLERHDFREAAGIAAMVAVSLTPVAVWAIESLTGLWPAETWGRPYYPEYRPAEATRWLIAELATVLAALLVLRRRRWSAVVFPVAVALFGFVIHLPNAIGIDLTPLLERWIMLTGALLVCAIADTVDRKTPRKAGPGQGDMAFPLWVVGLATLGFAVLAFWPTAGAWHHALPILGVGAVVISLMIGRKTHLVFGSVVIFMYLMYLAGEVFRSTAYFPVALAALGGAMLFATVWLQRRFPALAARLVPFQPVAPGEAQLDAPGARSGQPRIEVEHQVGTALGAHRAGRSGLPGSPVTPWLFVGLALGITLLRASEAVEERVNRDFQQRLFILRLHSGSLGAPPRPIFQRPGPDAPVEVRPRR